MFRYFNYLYLRNSFFMNLKDCHPRKNLQFLDYLILMKDLYISSNDREVSWTQLVSHPKSEM